MQIIHPLPPLLEMCNKLINFKNHNQSGHNPQVSPDPPFGKHCSKPRLSEGTTSVVSKLENKNAILAKTKLFFLLGSLLSLCPIIPNLQANQPHLPGHLGTKPAGVSEPGSGWIRLGVIRHENRRLLYRNCKLFT